MKKKLQEFTEYKVMTVEEAMTVLGFTWEETENKYNNITCSCGELADLFGFLGCEYISCKKCDKKVIDLSSPLPTSVSTVGFVNWDEYEAENEYKYWIAVDGNGGIKA